MVMAPERLLSGGGVIGFLVLAATLVGFATSVEFGAAPRTNMSMAASVVDFSVYEFY